MMIDIVNPKTSVRSQVELPLSDAAMAAARVNTSASEFVRDLARPLLPAGFMLLGSDLKTP